MNPNNPIIVQSDRTILLEVDRKSTRLNSSHSQISYAVFCLKKKSLLAALDRTVTPMGGRKLRSWILQPLRDLQELECRQQLIADLLHEADLLAGLRACLKSIRDLERATGRLSQASGNGRDLVALKISLQQIPELKAELRKLIERTEFGKGAVPGRDAFPKRPTNLAAADSTDASEKRPYHLN